jgi:hypothetical protein
MTMLGRRPPWAWAWITAGEALRLVELELAAQADRPALALGDPGRAHEIAVGDLDRREQAAAALEPAGAGQHRPVGLGVAGDRADHRPPVLGVGLGGVELEETLAGHREGVAAGRVVVGRPHPTA